MARMSTYDMIDDRYWLSRARTLVDNAVTSREEAAGKLVTGVGWFWTVYSTVAIVGTAIARMAFPWWVATVLALPAVFLMIAYLLALWVMIPYEGSFDPSSPDEIEEVYEKVVDLKRRRLKLAVFALIVASVFVVGAILTASVMRPTGST
jgi:hypothetical protein